MLSIRYHREKNNLTQAELAAKLGVNSNTVTQWETGARKPNIIMLKSVAKLLNCTTDELLEELPAPKQ